MIFSMQLETYYATFYKLPTTCYSNPIIMPEKVYSFHYLFTIKAVLCDSINVGNTSRQTQTS